jgi:hypothetical protein
MLSRDMLNEHYLSNISVGTEISKTRTITTILMITNTGWTDRGQRRETDLANCGEEPFM